MVNEDQAEQHFVIASEAKQFTRATWIASLRSQ